MKGLPVLPSLLGLVLSAPTLAQQVDHSKMDHSKMDHSTRSEQIEHSKMDHSLHAKHIGLVPVTPIPALTDVDRAAALPPQVHMQHLDNSINSYSQIERLETWNADPGTGVGWETGGWIGTDTQRFRWASDGERVDGHTESATLELLYGQSLSAWWDGLIGVRHDFRPGQAQTFATVGIQGLAQQKIEVALMASLGQNGQTALDLELEYELPLSGKLMLQPTIEISAYGKDDMQRGVGAGLSTLEAGLRLRYEFTRKFAPYVGLVHERSFGKTADMRHDLDEETRESRFVIGVRTWF